MLYDAVARPELPGILEDALLPLLAKRFDVSASPILRCHRDVELHARIEREEERLGEHGDVGRAVYVDHKCAAAFPVSFGEICRFRFDGFEDFLYLRPCRSVPD